MEKTPLCLIGCGGMGHRHILAYKELEESGIGNIELLFLFHQPLSLVRERLKKAFTEGRGHVFALLSCKVQPVVAFVF